MAPFLFQLIQRLAGTFPPLCYKWLCSWASESTDASPQTLNSKVISSGFPLSSLKKSWHLEYILYIKTQSNKLTKVRRSAASKHSWTGSNHMMSLVSLWAEARRCSALFWAWLWISLFFRKIIFWSLKPRNHLLQFQQCYSFGFQALVPLVKINSFCKPYPEGNSSLLLTKVFAEA